MPFVLWVAAGAISSVVAVLIGKSVYDSVHKQGGVVVSVVGPRRVGKTSLWRFLIEGAELPIDYVPTQTARSENFEAKGEVDGRAWILRLDDLGGEPRQVAQWSKSEVARKSDWIWFLTSAVHLADDDSCERVEIMARSLAIQDLNAQYIVVVTHADLDKAFDGTRPESLSVAAGVKKLSRILNAPHIVVGSLDSNTNAERLTQQLIRMTQP